METLLLSFKSLVNGEATEKQKLTVFIIVFVLVIITFGFLIITGKITINQY